MQFYIKQWSDHRVSLMTELGDVLASFSSVQDAMRVCMAWNLINEKDAFNKVLIHDNSMNQPASTSLNS